jgi:propanol-preferring alcohol dehydrogenase
LPWASASAFPGWAKLAVVALTRQDGDAFFSLVADLPLQIHVQAFALQDANKAVQALRDGTVNGAAVLIP